MSNLKERIREAGTKIYHCKETGTPNICECDGSKNCLEEQAIDTVHSLLLEVLADQEKVALGAVPERLMPCGRPVTEDHREYEGDIGSCGVRATEENYEEKLAQHKDCWKNPYSWDDIGWNAARSSLKEALEKYRQGL